MYLKGAAARWTGYNPSQGERSLGGKEKGKMVSVFKRAAVRFTGFPPALTYCVSPYLWFNTCDITRNDTAQSSNNAG